MQYQLIYNGHPANPLLNTLEEAEQIKQRAAISMPEIMVENSDCKGGRECLILGKMK